MELFNRIETNITRIFNTYLDSPLFCIILTCIFSVSTICCLRSIVCGLFKMHRSGSALKKLLNSYSFCAKCILLPAWNECLHAKRFCKFLILVHNVRFVLLISSISLALLSNIISVLVSINAVFSGIIFFTFDIPILVMHRVMDQHPFKRQKNKYRFQKYHKTKNYNSLF